jgi:signal peptidase
MSPALMEGDIVAWTPMKIEDIKVGDVIVFKSKIHWPDEKILVHRVSGVLTNNNGQIMLETKGDKNKFTDQAGPHIPEPYIRENNLMGKVLSIGQQPLKLPFVGYIGLWINEGLNLISQPTSSKESFSYVGIFTPLTISVLLFVILIFILPEKAKTFKEKIRLNIFGRKPLKLKKTIIIFLIAYIVFFSVIHVFANESISASVGIREKSPDSMIDFGRLKPGITSSKRPLPVINPSTMPVKGFIFGNGEMKDLVQSEIFQLEKGETKTVTVKVKTEKTTPNGSYLGDIMVYSSPFWLMFHDDLVKNLVNWNPHGAIFILDLLSAVILTFITMLILVSISFIAEKYSNLSIDFSWRHAPRTILKMNTVKKIVNVKNKLKTTIGKSMGWIMRVDLSKSRPIDTSFSKYIKPAIPALTLIPILYLIEDQLIAMFFAVIIAGLFAYFVSCKLRNKIIITTVVTMGLAISHMIIQSNLVIISKYETIIEFWSVAFGAIGVYILLFTLLLIPLALCSWAIIHLIRNLKERKDPLLSLDGNCDL